MPGIEEKKPEQALAICAAPERSRNIRVLETQPRQPKNLQGLLKFCMEATQVEDAPQGSNFLPMDEETKKWLNNALKSMTVDVIELLRKQLHILEHVKSIKPGDDITKFEEAMEMILDHVDNIDIACDFHKIGGFMILFPCLDCDNPKIRAAGCELLAELCQNNPYCQEIVLDNEFVSKLLKIIEEDKEIQVTIKAVYALSAIVRDTQEGFGQFIHYNGPVLLLNALNRGDDKLITKITFLLSSLCSSQPDFKSRLVFLEYVPTLISLFSKERQNSHEYILALLATLVEENTTALSECRNPTYDLNRILQNYVQQHKDKEECLEEIQHCRRLLYLVFGVNEE